MEPRQPVQRPRSADGQPFVVHEQPINGRYAIIESGSLGSGGFGEVLKVMDCVSGENKALKRFTCSSTYAHSEIAITKELSEHDTQGRVVKFFEDFMYRSSVYFAMNLEPCNLSEYQRFRHPDGLTPKKVRSIAFTLLAGLVYLKERKVIHCDIKPNNILLTDNGTRSVIADFGNACRVASDGLVRVPKKQNVNYEAPELALGYNTHYALDMWNTGRTLVEVLLSHPRVLRCRTKHEAITRLCQWVGDPPVSCLEKTEFFSQRFCRSLTRVAAKPYRPSLKAALLTKTHARIERQFSRAEALVETMVLHDLLKRMMQWEPATRITPEEARKHKFFSSIWTKKKRWTPKWIQKVRQYHKKHKFNMMETS